MYLTAACFANNVYDNAPAGRCVSNLLASQLQRYVIDLYWDVSNRRFSLCPVELPTSNATTTQTANATLQSPVASQGSSSTNSTTSTTAAPSPANSFSTVESNNGRTLFQIGQYQCSNTLSLQSILNVFHDYTVDTSDTTQAKLSIITINLHVATSVNNSNTSYQMLQPSDLPTAEQSVRTFFGELDNLLYKPGALFSDRQSLNASWFRKPIVGVPPASSYYSLYTAPNGDLATTDGWPDELFVQRVRAKRILVGFGSVDDNFRNYNTTVDSDRVFAPGYLLSEREVTLNNNGTLSKGCFHIDTAYSPRQANNSWAITSINTINPLVVGDAADNFTTCGISPILNVTLNNSSAEVSPLPYQNFGNNAVFSWAYGQPQNDSNADGGSASSFRCALMVSNDAFRGHWRVEYCNYRYRAACRDPTNPYRWALSSSKVEFASASAACPSPATTFEAPRTGLENFNLYTLVTSSSRDDPSLLDGVWINLNALRVENCWITTGANGTCPYYQNPNVVYSRQILIPTLAAFIVLILTALTVLVKCSNNARDSRKVRRGDGGWDYEGVPS